MKKVPIPACLTHTCAAFLLLSLSFSAGAQCSLSLKSISYDTLVTGSGNDVHSLTISKFDPSLGTLVAARINSVVSVNYGFVLKNVESVMRNFTISVGRQDYFHSAALSSDYTNNMQANVGTYLLHPGNTVTQGLTTIINRYVNSDSVVFNLANFMGAGSVNFDYEPITYTNLLGSANYYFSASANDTVHFSITYFYCNASVLPLHITSFTAVKEEGPDIKLSWNTASEIAARSYEVQESSDGAHFVPVSVVASVVADDGTGKYTYRVPLLAEDTKHLFFRLKSIDPDGQAAYSETREVTLPDEAKMVTVYPNPASRFIHIAFNVPQNTDWQVDILAPQGSVILRKFYSNARAATVELGTLAAGIYFMRATDRHTQKSYLSSFVAE